MERKAGRDNLLIPPHYIGSLTACEAQVKYEMNCESETYRVFGEDLRTACIYSMADQRYPVKEPKNAICRAKHKQVIDEQASG